MKVKWLNCRLTFQGETTEEREALKAVWAAFGSQVDSDFYDSPKPDEYELEDLNIIDPLVVVEVTETDD